MENLNLQPIKMILMQSWDYIYNTIIAISTIITNYFAGYTMPPELISYTATHSLTLLAILIIAMLSRNLIKTITNGITSQIKSILYSISQIPNGFKEKAIIIDTDTGSIYKANLTDFEISLAHAFDHNIIRLKDIPLYKNRLDIMKNHYNYQSSY